MTEQPGTPGALETFLTARLDEEERWAKTASDGQGWWLIGTRSPDHRTISEYVIEGPRGPVTHIDIEDQATAVHRCEALLMQTYNPGRILAEIAMKREMIELIFEHEAFLDSELGCGHNPTQISDGECPDIPPDGIRGLRILASAYSGDSHYQQEWKIEP